MGIVVHQERSALTMMPAACWVGTLPLLVSRITVRTQAQVSKRQHPTPLVLVEKVCPPCWCCSRPPVLKLAHSSAVGSLCNFNGSTFCNQAAHCIHEFEPKTQHGTTNRPSTQNTHLSPFLGPLSCTNDCPTLQIGMHTPTCHHIYTPSVTVACAAWSPLTP
jgi:hypothetical protein